MAALLEQRIEELRTDRAHGGSFMARRAVETLVEVARETPAERGEELLDHLVAAGRELAAARPAVAAITGAVGRLLGTARAAAQLPADDLRRVFEDEAAALIAARDRAAGLIAIHLRERLHEAFVLTHSASATVREAIAQTPPERVICTVSAPFEEGRAFAEDLRAQGLNVDLVEDDAADEALAHASLFLVGADTVFYDGAVCNKVGTARLAAAAQALGVPTLIASEVIKLAPVAAGQLEELSRIDQSFDVTPPEHVDEIVTEEGSVAPDSIGALIDRTPFLRDGYALLRPLAAET